MTVQQTIMHLFFGSLDAFRGHPTQTNLEMLKNFSSMLASRANPEQYKTQSYVNNSHFPAGFGNSWTFFILHLRILCRKLLNSFPE